MPNVRVQHHDLSELRRSCAFGDRRDPSLNLARCRCCLLCCTPIILATSRTHIASMNHGPFSEAFLRCSKRLHSTSRCSADAESCNCTSRGCGMLALVSGLMTLYLRNPRIPGNLNNGSICGEAPWSSSAFALRLLRLMHLRQAQSQVHRL